jgi:hypothetical protein
MSSASIPPPRSSSTSSSRHNYFWPILVFFVSAGTLAFYQVQSLEDQLGEVTNAVDRLDPKVKHAEYEKAKFYAMARDLVRLAPKHPAAEQIVDQTGIHTLQVKFPELMSLDIPSGFTNTAPGTPANQAAPESSTTPGDTNASPLAPAPDTK